MAPPDSLDRPSAPTTSPRRPRVLIIDDEPMVATAIRRALSACDVTLAGSGATALEIAKTARLFDIVLCDVMMPGLTGPEVYKAMCLIDPGIKDRFIFVTGGAVGIEANQALDRLALPIIAKPFDVPALRELVATFTPRPLKPAE